MNEIRATVIFLVSMTAAGILFLSACGKNKQWRDLAWGYRILNGSARLGESFDRGLKAGLEFKLAECKKKLPALPVNKAPTPAEMKARRVQLAKCMKDIVKVSRAWTGEKRGVKSLGVLGALQKAQRSARTALDGAHDHLRSVEAQEKKCGEDKACLKKINAWKKPLQTALCAMLPLVEEGIKLGVPKVSDDPAFTFIKGLVKSWACGGK